MHSFSHQTNIFPQGQNQRHKATLEAFAIADKGSYDLGVFLACQVEAALLLGQLGNPPQHAFPLFGFCPLPGGHGFCHSLQDMQLADFPQLCSAGAQQSACSQASRACLLQPYSVLLPVCGK